MSRIFNVSAACKPELHYMVNMDEQVKQIKAMVDQGLYFSINRARQYGKTTTLHALERFLKKEYIVISMDFQMFSAADFETEKGFIENFCMEISGCVAGEDIPADIRGQMEGFCSIGKFEEVSYRTKNLKNKFVEEHKMNSPWNVAADFDIDLSLKEDGIAGMLADYEEDYHTGMNIQEIAGLIYEYTSGYPLQEKFLEDNAKQGYLVSFNFNKKKNVGVERLQIKDKVIIEAVV